MITKNTHLLLILIGLLSSCQSGAQTSDTPYTYKKGDPNGTGKWYMGREIAYVMGFQGMSWLERPEREKEENVSKLIRNMDIKPTDVIADIGAGSGYHVFKMAPIAKEGLIYAVDIQEEMLNAIRQKMKKGLAKNVTPIKGNDKSVELPENTVDKILMVDVYHEFSYPIEMIASMKKALKTDGKIYLIEYRGEDPKVPIKDVHKMTQAQSVKEMEAAGFKLEVNLENLPWQHCMVFVKR